VGAPQKPATPPLGHYPERMAPFDPDAAAQPGSGIFGLPLGPDDAWAQVLGVPFDATTSYRRGTMHGPEAIVAASVQVDLHDRLFPGAHEGGIHYVGDDGTVESWNQEARALANPIIAAGGADPDDDAHQQALARVNHLGDALRGHVHKFTEGCFAAKRLPVLLGGDHSIPFGSMEAAAGRFDQLGVLQFDAHADLRESYEGFRWSHASIFHNVLEELPQVSSLVQVGVRDLGHGEALRCAEDERITTLFDDQWAKTIPASAERDQIMQDSINTLPKDVWVSFDIDGLSPDLCPHTGTPVPGGLDWHSAMAWLQALVQSGRTVVGLDLCEVAPGPDADPQGTSWDAVVGARLLYRLIGAARCSHQN